MLKVKQLNPQISIVIPVYKVENYLEECLNSVINQTFKDWVAICVDDGSPDNCGKILDIYADKDSRIKVIHQSNRGISEARNAAFKYIDTPYIMFLDSDDVLHKQAMKLAYDKINETGADIVWFDITEFNDGEVIEQITISNNNKIKTYNNPFKFYVAKDKVFTTHKTRMPGVIWNKLYKTEFVKKTPFASGISIGEDMLFTIEIVAKVNKLAHLQENLYFYRQRPGSIMHSLESEKLKENMRKEINYYKKIKNELIEQNSSNKIKIFDKYLTNRVFFKKIFRPFLRGRKNSQSKEYIDDLIKSGMFDFKKMKFKFKLALFLYQRNYTKLSKFISRI